MHVIIMGGTIDSYYDSTKDTAVPNEKSVIPKYIEDLKIGEVTFTELCMKDSRDVGEKDLRNLVSTINKSKKIIVTHGTYTMPESARFVKFNLKRDDQAVIFTGSMIPLVGFSPSDAGFNLGYAFASLEHLEPGVYVSMNGSAFSPDEVVKLLREGRFSSVFGEN